MKRTLQLAVLTVAALALAPGRAAAATATGTFTVQATVSPICTVAASTLDFGIYDPNSATAKTGTSVVTLTCTKSTAYAVGLTSANGATFAMKNGANTLNYVLYSDAGMVAVWDGAIANRVSGVAGSRAGIPLNVYGRIPVNQDVPTSATNYTDTVTATVNF